MFLANSFAFASLVLCVAGSPIGEVVNLTITPDAPSWPVVFPIAESPEDERVYFGDEPVEDYPSIVSLGILVQKQAHHVCGGSLITDQHILTAAHCYNANVETFRAVFGSRHKLYPRNADADVIEFGRDAWKINPGYKGEPTDWIYDTAVITLPRKVMRSNAIKPIPLAKKVYPNSVRVVGWGRMNCNRGFPDNYLYARGWIVDDRTCARVYQEPTDESQICAQFINNWGQLSGSDSGDSGGPLYAKANGQDVQIGVVSLSQKRNHKTPKECVKVDSPMKYAKVAQAEEFIKSVAPNAQFV